MSNLARYNIQQINDAIRKQQELENGIGKTTTAAAEMKKAEATANEGSK